jgi:uncharacterized membrane protein HdeD (DUF308 family)
MNPQVTSAFSPNLKSLNRQIWATVFLGSLVLVAGVFAHLALTDIFHGEQDLRLEWKIVQVAALVLFAFTLQTLFTLSRVMRFLKSDRSAQAVGR